MNLDRRVSKLEQTVTGDTSDCTRRIFEGLKFSCAMASEITGRPAHSDEDIMKEAEALSQKFGHDYDRYLHGKHELPAEVKSILRSLGC